MIFHNTINSFVGGYPRTPDYSFVGGDPRLFIQHDLIIKKYFIIKTTTFVTCLNCGAIWYFFR